MSEIKRMLQSHKLSCESRQGKYPCTCGRDAAEAELAAMQARIEKLETEQTRLNKIIHAVEVASRRKLKSGETVYNIISAVQDALESE